MFSVIFDMDGTLLDTQQISVPAWDYAGKLQGYKNMGKHVPAMCGVTLEYCLDFLRKNFPELDAVEFKKQADRYEKENLVVQYKPGAEELLKFLKQNNIKTAVASGSSPEIIKERLGAVNAEGRFDVILSGWEVEHGKPEPDIFLKAAELLGAEPENCFVFEDSVNGIIAAHKAGMKAIGVPDLVQFDENTKKLMFTQLNSLAEPIDLLKKYV